MINTPFKYQTNAKAYKPLGIPKVRMPKLPNANKMKGMPKMPKQPRITILDKRL